MEPIWVDPPDICRRQRSSREPPAREVDAHVGNRTAWGPGLLVNSYPYYFEGSLLEL